jgi:hypothetical protein
MDLRLGTEKGLLSVAPSVASTPSPAIDGVMVVFEASTLVVRLSAIVDTGMRRAAEMMFWQREGCGGRSGLSPNQTREGVDGNARPPSRAPSFINYTVFPEKQKRESLLTTKLGVYFIMFNLHLQTHRRRATSLRLSQSCTASMSRRMQSISQSI